MCLHVIVCVPEGMYLLEHTAASVCICVMYVCMCACLKQGGFGISEYVCVCVPEHMCLSVCVCVCKGERITHPLRRLFKKDLSQSSYIFINKNNQIMSSFPISSLMPTFQ